MPIDIDWPLTLQLLGAIFGAFAVPAAIYSWLSYRLYRRLEMSSTTSITVGATELFILRLIHDVGPLGRRYYHDNARTVQAWKLLELNGFIVPEANEPRNAWVFSTIEALKRRDLALQDREGSTIRLTEEGRAVVRRDSKQEIPTSKLPKIFLVDQNGKAVPLPERLRTI